MGVQEEAKLAAAVVKGRRSKRQRAAHAVVVVISAAAAVEPAEESTESSLSLSGGAGAVAAEGSSSTTSPSRGEEAASGCVTEEEEDMAHCLMLLARGGHGERARVGEEVVEATVAAAAAAKEAKFRSRRPAEGAAGEFVYECKTCSKCFPSFQALGGHRTSHKKPRLIAPATEPADDKKPAVAETPAASEKPKPSPPRPTAKPTTDPTVLAIPVIPKQEVVDTTAAAITSSSKQPRVHECSICGAEFASGQALGGHMRRHRPLLPASASASAVDDTAPRKEKSLLELDLNMPAPCDDAAETSATSQPPAAAPFTFAVNGRSPLLVPAALIGCHY
ncbi:hypothetical protein ABZP36_003436 [Zizania latifolia]